MKTKLTLVGREGKTVACAIFNIEGEWQPLNKGESTHPKFMPHELYSAFFSLENGSCINIPLGKPI